MSYQAAISLAKSVSVYVMRHPANEKDFSVAIKLNYEIPSTDKIGNPEGHIGVSLDEAVLIAKYYKQAGEKNLYKRLVPTTMEPKDE